MCPPAKALLFAVLIGVLCHQVFALERAMLDDDDDTQQQQQPLPHNSAHRTGVESSDKTPKANYVRTTRISLSRLQTLIFTSYALALPSASASVRLTENATRRETGSGFVAIERVFSLECGGCDGGGGDGSVLLSYRSVEDAARRVLEAGLVGGSREDDQRRARELLGAFARKHEGLSLPAFVDLFADAKAEFRALLGIMD